MAATYSTFETGPQASWGNWSYRHPAFAREVPGKLFLQEKLGLTSMEVSVNQLPPGGGVPFLHRHREHEELYLFLSGEGEFQVDGEVFAVKEGTAVRVSPAGARGLRNTGEGPLVYVVIQAKAGSVGASTSADGRRVEGRVQWPLGATAPHQAP